MNRTPALLHWQWLRGQCDPGVRLVFLCVTPARAAGREYSRLRFGFAFVDAAAAASAGRAL